MSKHLAPPGSRAHVSAIAERIGALPAFDATSLEAAIRDLATERGVKAGTLIHATRVAVTGRAASPGLFEVLELVGRERVLARLTHAATLAG